MKVLIWFLCAFFASGTVFALNKANNIQLGAIPIIVIYGCAIWLARSLCAAWDKKQAKLDIKQAKKKAKNLNYIIKLGDAVSTNDLFDIKDLVYLHIEESSKKNIEDIDS